MKRRQSSDIDNDAAAAGDINVHYKRERRKARKVIVERLRRERIDRCLEQLKLWLQDSTPYATAPVTQGDLSNLEKADILELTVDHLRQMVASTEKQYSVGYSACVQEVNNFLRSFRYNDVTRQRIVHHLCHQRPVVPPSVAAAASQANDSQRTTDIADEPTGPTSPVAYQHLRMCSYSSPADSTTGGGEDSSRDSITAVSCPIIRNSHTPDEPDQSCGNAFLRHPSGAALANENVNSLQSSAPCDAIGGVLSDDINNNNNIGNFNYNNDSNDDRIGENKSTSCVWRPW